MKKTVSGPFLSRGNNAETTPLLSGEREMNHIADGGSVVVENDVSHVCRATFVTLPYFGPGEALYVQTYCMQKDCHFLPQKMLQTFCHKKCCNILYCKSFTPIFQQNILACTILYVL